MDEFLIYDPIFQKYWPDDPVVGAKDLKEFLDAHKDQEVLIRFNCPGGDVFEGAAMYRCILDHGKAHCVIDGACISAATTACMGGKSIKMADNGLFMIHDPATYIFGGVTDLERAVDSLKSMKTAIINSYARSNLNKAKLDEMMTAETWMNADDCLKANFIDEVLTHPTNQKPSENFDFKAYRNMPTWAADRIKSFGKKTSHNSLAVAAAKLRLAQAKNFNLSNQPVPR